MSNRKSGWFLNATLFLAASIAAPLSAGMGASEHGVREGVEAWSRGDYVAAVAQWRGPADAGDPDALFNMGQAFRLGRGVPQDLARAEGYYALAARAGHVRASDTYGLMLFQNGRREAALPFVEAAARRGDPRAQYLLGIAHFNGDLVTRDWERAYALLTLANGAGLPQAVDAIAEMDEHIPISQRQNAATLARQLEAEAEQARAVELAAADLSVQDGPPIPAHTPQPVAEAPSSPAVIAARDAVSQARDATGTGDPANAGASYANASTAGAIETTTRAIAAPAPTPAAARGDGPWRVQLGAFAVAGNAERLWARLSERPEISGRERLLLPTGRVTRLQAGGFSSRDEARVACNSLRRSGQDCLVTRN
ncbi:sporulation protein [Aurantiacibacter atlanticus]|uniref:Sporulation protein n=1 Tax=Aurantiacibacter atlanticus TaxID=1648404 RepID=A0A0H4VEY9_9SPHN|nr:SPOR domain-containing protein [Aurantiacibacter atlanticus]AKQ41664.1 sporulation protein [Aurantiacibacter atlanticus]